jgi:hypothetical protein
MTVGDLFFGCRAMGIYLTSGPDGTLCWEADTDPPADLLAGLAAHKADVLARLRGVPPWNQAEADRLLSELRAEIQQIAAGFGGQLPHPLGMLLGDAVRIGERFVREHDAEAGLGWDALDLLRGLVPMVRECVENHRQREALRSDDSAPAPTAPPALTATKERQHTLFVGVESVDDALADR